MNERIKELAIDTCDQMGWDGTHLAIDSFTFTSQNLEKFAELIVRECCQKLENDGMVEVAMELKEHFGVEK